MAIFQSVVRMALSIDQSKGILNNDGTKLESWEMIPWAVFDVLETVYAVKLSLELGHGSAEVKASRFTISST